LTRSRWRSRAVAPIAGWFTTPIRAAQLGNPSPVEFERQHTQPAEPALERSISASGSVASSAPRAADRLRTRRVSTVGVDFVADGSISPEIALAVPTGSAQAATAAVEGRTAPGGLAAR
jgi:hypothetical protein